MKRLLLATAAAAVIALTVGSAAQAGVLYDQDLSSPSGDPTDAGWFDGSGNPNGGFAVSTDGTVTVALRAKLRQDPNVIDSLDGIYQVPAGAQPGSPGHAAWNWEFSVSNCSSAPICSGDIAGLLHNSTITVTDLTTGHTNTVALDTWGDDAVWGTNGRSLVTGGDSSAWVAQNSENPIFGDFPLNGFYTENAQDAYKFTINVPGVDGMVSDSIYVLVGDAKIPTPEASSISMVAAGLALFGFGAIRRKKSASSATA